MFTPKRLINSLSGLTLGLLCTWGATAAPERPNIIVILVDDLGYAAVSHNPLHPKTVSTPNIDSIARNGAAFNQAYLPGNVCSPSRAGILSGRYPQRAQVYTAGEGGRGMSLDINIIPTFLKPAGYHTVAFGKWHLGTDIAKSPLNRGFDEFFGFLGRGAHDYFNLSDDAEPLYRGLEPVKATGYLTDVLTDEAVSFIIKNKAKPFFMYLAYNAVHSPNQAPAETEAKYVNAKAIDPKFQNKEPKGPIKTYLAMLEHLDIGVGRVLTTLKNEGLDQNTIIFFLSDNGGAFDPAQFNAPLRGNKHENWEGGVRTPFFVSWPKHVKAGTQINAPIMAIDILPTLIDIVGQPLPTDKPLDGKSLMPLLNGKATTIHDQLYWSGGSETGWWSTRAGDWKLIALRDDIQLFNLAEDPMEQNNLANKNPEKLAELRKSFDAWIDGMPDPMSKGQTKVWVPGQASAKKVKKPKKAAE